MGAAGAVLISLVGCERPVEQQSPPPPEQLTLAAANVGWLQGSCLAIQRTDLTAAQPLTVVSTGAGQASQTAGIVRAAKDGTDCPALLPDRAAGNRLDGWGFYVIDTPQPIEMAIGILGTGHDLKRYRFQSCMTSEGVQFSAWREGKQVWNGYEYLGYDSEANCPPESATTAPEEPVGR